MRCTTSFSAIRPNEINSNDVHSSRTKMFDRTQSTDETTVNSWATAGTLNEVYLREITFLLVKSLIIGTK